MNEVGRIVELIVLPDAVTEISSEPDGGNRLGSHPYHLCKIGRASVGANDQQAHGKITMCCIGMNRVDVY